MPSSTAVNAKNDERSTATITTAISSTTTDAKAPSHRRTPCQTDDALPHASDHDDHHDDHHDTVASWERHHNDDRNPTPNPRSTSPLPHTPTTISSPRTTDWTSHRRNRLWERAEWEREKRGWRDTMVSDKYETSREIRQVVWDTTKAAAGCVIRIQKGVTKLKHNTG